MMFFIFYVKDYQKLCLNHLHIMTTLALKALGFGKTLPDILF